MTTPRLIGIAGKKQHGKDTLAKYLLTQFPSSYRIGFADELKEEVADACQVTVPEIEKNKPLYRPILQWWGTEFRRNKEKDYWLKAMEEHLECFTEAFIILIPDVRFFNEADFIKSRGGILLKVVRTNYPDDNDTHASENELNDYEFDHTLVASNTQELHEEAKYWLLGNNYLGTR